MLDHFTIFTKNGLILWSTTFTPALSNATSSSNPVHALIKHAFLEQRTADHKFDKDGYTLRWSFANELGLTFVVVYQRILQLSYIDELLERIKSLFIQLFAPFIRNLIHSSTNLTQSARLQFAASLNEWQHIFTKNLRHLEKAASQNNRNALPSSVLGDNRNTRSRAHATSVVQAERSSAESTPLTPTDVDDATEIARNMQALKNRLKAESGPGGRKGIKPKKPISTTPDTPPNLSGTESPSGKKGKPAKEMRKWDGSRSVSLSSSHNLAQLDFSVGHEATPHTRSTALDNWIDEKSMGKKRSDGVYEIADVFDDEQESEEDEDEDDEDNVGDNDKQANSGSTGSASLLSRFSRTTSSSSSFLSRLTGSKTLTKEDLTPALNAMASHLQSKNVAADVAQRVCDSVERSLIGKSLGSFASVKAEVRQALSEAITRILTPRSSTDILLEIATKKQRSVAAASVALASTVKEKEIAMKPDPYTICFVGVNGVGKSTNLAKVCFWLLQNRQRVLIAACDTFRAGAVEQLRVHVRNLGQLRVDGIAQEGRIELFERGYGKDAAGIAKDAITYAKAESYDVVLIDTAGRMQDNEPLMRALSKLVSVNRPDKVIFVGEALVGNEAVDQITKFDTAMKDFSGLTNPRGIDGSLLTKWDTVDDKVGTALTTTAATGLPIYFLGTGQTYTDLRQLRVHHVVNALLRH